MILRGERGICFAAFRPYISSPMVSVAQLAEHQIVALRVAGSTPVAHPEQASAGNNQRTFSFVRAKPPH